MATKISEALRRLTKVSFTSVKCPTCGAQPIQNQHNWREAKKCACPERKALARRVAGILRAHFAVAEWPCTGDAHKPEVGGMIDNCMCCAPRWGTVESLTPITAVGPRPTPSSDEIASAFRAVERADARLAFAALLVHVVTTKDDDVGREPPPEDRDDTKWRTLATTPNRSWAPEVIADSSGKWCGNLLRFATQEEAEANVQNLFMRWTLVRETRVVESTDPVNYAWDVERGLVDVRPTKDE